MYEDIARSNISEYTVNAVDLSLILFGYYFLGSEDSSSPVTCKAKETVKVFALIPLFSKEGLGDNTAYLTAHYPYISII